MNCSKSEGGWDESWAEVWEHGVQAKGDGRRAEVDEKVLGNLLRLNQRRAGRGE